MKLCVIGSRENKKHECVPNIISSMHVGITKMLYLLLSLTLKGLDYI